MRTSQSVRVAVALGATAIAVTTFTNAGCGDDDVFGSSPSTTSGGAPDAGGSGEACAPGTTTPSSNADQAPLGPASDVTVTGNIFKPNPLPAPDVSKIKVPPEFVLTKAAENLGNARLLFVATDGTVYVTRREEGDVLMLKPTPEGGFAPPLRVAARSGMHGFAIHDAKAYLATPNEVFRADVLADGKLGPLEMIIHDLPDAGQHNTRTVQIGPDGMMYLGIGSTCNECNETNPENATILRASLDGKQRAIWASGLRDPVGWGWHPATGELWATDHGIDWLGTDFPPEELNRVERGKRYGWPYFWGANKVNPHIDPPAGLSKEEWQKVSVPMVLGYTAHASPMQMSFYDGPQFPAEYRGDAFVSMRGSWNRKPASGYEIVRIHFENGQAKTMTPFVTGFVAPEGEYGRLCGNAVAADGSLLFTDDRNGVLYRLAYTGPAKNNQPKTTIPSGPMLEQAARGSGVPLAIARPETTSAAASVAVTSPSFAEAGPIPVQFSEYEQGASFPVAWTAGPPGTKSYALVMEDPDAAMPKPYVHWVVWNIPVSATSLRDGLQEQDLLKDPPGLRQGVTSRGKVGYLGPRPPEGDPPHTYHVQLFALDRVLDLPLTGATRDDVLAQMNGHVIAKGELTGTFARPPTQVSRP